LEKKVFEAQEVAADQGAAAVYRALSTYAGGEVIAGVDY
jgi:hypothetical protein